MKRREFLGAVAALVVAPFAPMPMPITFKGVPLISDATGLPMWSTSTYTFWRNRDQTADLTHLKREMRAIYDSCT